MTLERGDSPLAGRRPAPLSSVASIVPMNSLGRGQTASSAANSSALNSRSSLPSLASTADAAAAKGAGSPAAAPAGVGSGVGAPGAGNPAMNGVSSQGTPSVETSFWLELKGVERWFEHLEQQERVTLMTALFARSSEHQLYQFSSSIEKAVRNNNASSAPAGNLSRFGVGPSAPPDLAAAYRYRSPLSAGATSSVSSISVPGAGTKNHHHPHHQLHHHSSLASSVPSGSANGSQIGSQMGGSQIGSQIGGSQIGGSQIGSQIGGSQLGSSQIGSQMGSQIGGSQMGSQIGSSQIGSQLGSAQIGSQMGSQLSLGGSLSASSLTGPGSSLNLSGSVPGNSLSSLAGAPLGPSLSNLSSARGTGSSGRTDSANGSSAASSTQGNAGTPTTNANTAPAGSTAPHFMPLSFGPSTGSDLYSQAFLPLPRAQGYSPWGAKIRRPNSAAADAWSETATRGSPTPSVSGTGSPNVPSLSLDAPSFGSSAGSQTSLPGTQNASPLSHPLKPWRTFTPAHSSVQPQPESPPDKPSQPGQQQQQHYHQGHAGQHQGQNASQLLSLNQPQGHHQTQAQTQAQTHPQQAHPQQAHPQQVHPQQEPFQRTSVIGQAPESHFSRSSSLPTSLSSSPPPRSRLAPVGSSIIGTGDILSVGLSATASADLGSSSSTESFSSSSSKNGDINNVFKNGKDTRQKDAADSSKDGLVSPRSGSVPKDAAHLGRLARRGTVNVVDVTLLCDIGAWLRSLRLHKYTGNLSGMKWQDVIHLTDQDLEDRGVNALGARRKLLKIFEEIREAQEAGLISEDA